MRALVLGIEAMLVLACGSDVCRAVIIIPTNLGVGADAEVRESQPLTNFGASDELATRVRNEHPLGDPNDVNDRNGVMYLKFDLAGLTPADAVGTAVRLTSRNANRISVDRVHDTDGVDPDHGQNGLEYYGIPGATFDESTLTYLTAPGITLDGNVGTKDFNSSAVFIGDKDFSLGLRNAYPVGGEFTFGNSAALDAFIAFEIASNPNGVAVIAVVHRNNGAADEPASWKNFNYLFNPKEKTTLDTDMAFDADTTDPNNPLGSPFSGASNADGHFSPTLLLGVPEPSSSGLLGAVAVAMLTIRRAYRAETKGMRPSA